MKRGILLLCILTLLLSGCERNPERISVVGYYFDTVVTLSACCEKTVLDEALQDCAQWEALLSKTVEGSDVWRINHANGAPTEVSDDTIALLQLANEVSALSDGAFDITIASCVALWDFSGESGLPDAENLADAIKNTDYTKITIDGNTVTLPAGMQIDLGGIAKGYIADKIKSFLEEKGVSHALLNFGGNVVTLGTREDGVPWTIGIQDPASENGKYIYTVESTSSSVVTSGTYQRGFDLDGVRYHHILDTTTGMPVQNSLASVTVLSESSAYGDAVATACMALGKEKALELARNNDQIEIICVEKDGTITLSAQEGKG